MPRLSVYIFALTILISINTTAQQNKVINKDNQLYLSNTVILKLKDQMRTTDQKNFTPTPGIRNLMKEEGNTVYKYMFEYSGRKERSIVNEILEMTYEGSTDPLVLSSKLKQMPEVEWAEPRFVYKTGYIPNDQLYSTQWHLTKIQAPQAWDITRGDSSIVIGIIDTGVDWDHPDLSANIWRNIDEIPGNGVDDDGNGFVDDIRGWDFGGLNGTPDNNPMEDRPDHGTHVAGIAAAVTDNTIGVSSIGYRSRVMPVKASRDDIRTTAGQALIIYGYEGIQYAADNGAKIINLSWGGSGYSIAGQEIINAVVSQGVLVIGAAGNNQNSSVFYPSSYDNVLSVASTGPDDVRSFFSNYGITVDVSAPGTNLNSTWQNDIYAYLSGTSMAAPLVAGLAALVTKQFPLFNPLQIGEQIRVNTDDIYSLNPPAYNYLLGKGRINAFKALNNTTSKSVRATEFTFSDNAPFGDGDGIFEPGETISIRVDFVNYLNTTSNLVITLDKNNNFSTVVNNSFTAGQKGTLEIFDNSASLFSIQIANNVPQNSELMFRLNYSDDNYTDFQMFKVLVNPSYADHANGTILLTIASDGTLGFNDFPDNNRGSGFIYDESSNLLFEGALILGTASNKISDVARVISTRNTDFSTVQPFILNIPGSAADQQGSTIFNDNAAGTNKIGVTVNLNSYTYSNDEDDDYIILRYTLKNNTAAAITNLYSGIYFDWDFANATSDFTAYDLVGNLGYVRRTTGNPDTWVGVATVSAPVSGFYAIRNDTTMGDVQLFDANGFTDMEKWLTISSGIGKPSAGPGDISNVVSSGPVNLNSGDSLDVAFAIAGGYNIDDLRNAISRARIRFQAILIDVEDAEVPVPIEYSLSQNFPNPFNPSTNIKYSLPEASRVTLKLYDILGTEIALLIDETKQPGIHTFELNTSKIKSLSSGVYFYTLKAGGFTSTKKMLILK
jgi:serine protease